MNEIPPLDHVAAAREAYIPHLTKTITPTWEKIFCYCCSSQAQMRLEEALDQINRLPAGQALIDLLIRKRNAGFDIRFSEISGGATGAASLALDGRRMVVRIDLNFAQLGIIECSRLTHDGAHYDIVPMRYPPFVTIAHEMVHALHFMERWEQLDKEFPRQVPDLGAAAAAWQEFFRVVTAAVPYNAIPGIEKLMQEGLSAAEYQRPNFSMGSRFSRRDCAT